MKKLGISLVAVLVGLPTIARADLAQLTKANITANTNVATTSFVGGAHDALVDAINADRTQINTNTSDIAGKQAQLVNDAQTAANIAGPVKTTVAAAATASDTALVTEKAVRTAVDNAITAATYDDTALAGRVTTLEGTVGDNSSGLVKDVADLQTTVGDNTAGLVKDVADNASDISALQTTVGDNTAGLVKDVADLQTTVGDASSGLVKDVADLQTAASTTKGFAVHGTWGSPTTATGHVNVVDSSTLNP